MTASEILGGVIGALGAAATTYGLVVSKIESVVGRKGKDGDSASLREMVARVEGKIDANREHAAEQFEALGTRLEVVEARVLTPPARRAFRSDAE
jgi:hypothetical protein